jgi:hypothetical protein
VRQAVILGSEISCALEHTPSEHREHARIRDVPPGSGHERGFIVSIGRLKARPNPKVKNSTPKYHFQFPETTEALNLMANFFNRKLGH